MENWKIIILLLNVILGTAFLLSSQDKHHLKKRSFQWVLLLCSIGTMILSNNIAIFALGWSIFLLGYLYKVATSNVSTKKFDRRFLLIQALGLSALIASQMVTDHTPLKFILLAFSTLSMEGFFPFHRISINSLHKNSSEILQPFFASHCGIIFLCTQGHLLFYQNNMFSEVFMWTIVLGMLYLGFLSLGSRSTLNTSMLLHFLQTGIGILIALVSIQKNLHSLSLILLICSSLTLVSYSIFTIGNMIEKRIGLPDLRSVHIGLYKSMPILANAYLVTILVAINLPGSISFIMEDSLMHLMTHSVDMKIFIVLASFLFASIGSFQTYIKLFGGKPLGLKNCDANSMERKTLAACFVSLLVFGVCPLFLG